MNDTVDISTKIGQIDSHFQELYYDTASYLKILEKTRIKMERLGTHLKDYAAIETAGLKNTLTGLSDSVYQIEDRRKELYDRLQIKVFEGFKNYEVHCKDAKDALKRASDADQVQSKRQRELSAINAKNKGDLAKVSTARNALAKATQDAKGARDNFHAHLETFEKQKIRDLKEIWGDWLHSHILYHSKCLEILTRAHGLIINVDEDEEMESVLRVTRARQAAEDPMLSSPDLNESGSRPSTPGTPNLARSTSVGGSPQFGRGSYNNSPQSTRSMSMSSSPMANTGPRSRSMSASNALQSSTGSMRPQRSQSQVAVPADDFEDDFEEED